MVSTVNKYCSFIRPITIKRVVLILAIWIACMSFGYFYNEGVKVFTSVPLKGLVMKGFDAQIRSRTESTTTTTPAHDIKSLGGPTSTKNIKIGTGQASSLNIEPITQPDTPRNPEGCQFPNLDPFDPAVMSTVVHYPPLDCSEGVPNLVYLEGDTMKVNASKIPSAIKNKQDYFKWCKYRVHTKRPGSDFVTNVDKVSPPFNTSINISAEEEHIITECFNSTGHVISRSYFSLIRPKPKLEEELSDNYRRHMAQNKPLETLSILLFGIDGMSSQSFIRHMPKTRAFLLDVLKATEMHKYNKIGLNTYPNVMGLLTGRRADSFLNKKWSLKSHFDPINDAFIWSTYRRSGYRTGVMIDGNRLTAFHFHKKGWNKDPVDYYTRPMTAKCDWDDLMRHENGNCVGDIPRITLFHDCWVQMASIFNNTPSKPYFGYSFTHTLTHDDHNKASEGDHLHYKFLKELHDKNVLNNTVIIWFSDHGERFGPIRSTFNGAIESRTPYLYLVFPLWFHKKYPHLMEVLKTNQERLTSHFDVYETMRDLLYFNAETGKGDINKRGISLFKEIPRERTCDQMEIATEFCVCNNITKVNVSEKMSEELGLGVIKSVVESTKALRAKCVELSLKSVKSVLGVKSYSFQETARRGPGELYQVTIVTEPGEAIYEATVHYGTRTRNVSALGQVVRLNFYRGQADCINDPILKQFCYCKNLGP